jgi:hypothetical protein
MPEFEPDARQKRFVAAMAGMRMSWDEILLVVINLRTGRPISKETLQKAFAHELEAGKAQLKARIIAKYYAKLDDDDWNAINFGFEHICGFRCRCGSAPRHRTAAKTPTRASKLSSSCRGS